MTHTLTWAGLMKQQEEGKAHAKAKILIDDLGGRFKADEIGILLPHNSVKYDYYLQLPRTYQLKNFLSIPGTMVAVRQYYFYADEVELLDANVIGAQDTIATE